MKPTQDKYPVFEANQVLTNAHLNQAINYLDEQGRLTCANLIGVGIVCGLEIKFDAVNALIHISKGCGITSEGYQIVESDVDLVSYRDYKVPDDLAYTPFEGKTLLELLADNSGTVLDSTFLSDNSEKAVLLFLELKNEPLRNCSPNNCDDKGAAITVTVHRLLINLDELKSYSPLELSEVPLPRINFSTLVHFSNYEQVYRDFFTLGIDGKTVVNRLDEAIELAYQALKVLIPELSNSGAVKLTSLFDSLSNVNVISIQYYYDFLRDLTAAYHELRIALLQQLAICLPDSNLFPRHLVLGSANKTETKHYRTVFFASPAMALPKQKLEELRFLFDRLNQMVQNFNIQSGSEIPIKITPSLFGLKHLSGKSMPFYYNPIVRQQWDPERKGQQSKEILSWHEDSSSPDSIRNPLQYDLEPYNFFRIEGHIGKNIVNVTTSLGDTIKANRLPISILYINADAVGGFLERHFAIEHEAGAVRGGTFVVFYGGTGPNTNLVLADFALPYRIENTESSACLGKVAIKECEYAWFDTRRHLSNLARRDYGAATEADKELLAKYYVILIYHYEIQGKSLINGGPEQVRIPIDELINGQLSAIARNLNEKFPHGVIFDHNTKTNKLVIRYFADHTFRIEWGGLQGNQIRYAYTPERIERWQEKTWEYLDNVSDYKVVCRLRDEYRPDQYKWLQEDNYNEAKYPTPVQMPTAQELIEWEKMIKGRAEIAISALPIYTILEAIKRFIDEDYNVGGDVVQVILIGSWANGSWVSRNSVENNFPADFLSLRQKVTGKNSLQHSDIDLLVNIENKQIKPEAILDALKADDRIKNSGYVIDIVFGKKDVQKGKVL